MREPTLNAIFSNGGCLRKPIRGELIVSLDSENYDEPSLFLGKKVLYFPRATGVPDSLVCNPTRKSSGCIEFWVKTDGWSYSGTTFTYTDLSPEPPYQGLTMFVMYANSVTGTHLIDVFLGQNQGIIAQIYTPGWVEYGIVCSTAANAIVDGEWTHFAFVWEQGGSPDLELYKNGVLIASATTGFPPITTGGSETCLGRRDDNVAWQGQIGVEGWMAGYREHDYPKRDFSDRFNDRAGMNDMVGY